MTSHARASSIVPIRSANFQDSVDFVAFLVRFDSCAKIFEIPRQGFSDIFPSTFARFNPLKKHVVESLSFAFRCILFFKRSRRWKDTRFSKQNRGKLDESPDNLRFLKFANFKISRFPIDRNVYLALARLRVRRTSTNDTHRQIREQESRAAKYTARLHKCGTFIQRGSIVRIIRHPLKLPAKFPRIRSHVRNKSGEREKERERERESAKERGDGELMNERGRGKFPARSKQRVPGIHFLARQRERSHDRFESFKGRNSLVIAAGRVYIHAWKN